MTACRTRWIAAMTVWLLAGGATAVAQAQGRGIAGTAEELIEFLNGPVFDQRVVNRLVELQAVEARPALRAAFDRFGEKREKQSIAAGLAALGEPDQRYFDYLRSLAEQVAESSMPFPLVFDSAGKIVPESHRTNQPFQEWCRAAGVDPDAVLLRAMTEDPMDILYLELARTAQAVPVFLKALTSSNPLVSAAAADGLAVLRETSYVPEVAAAARTAPGEAAPSFAIALLRLGTEEARAVAEELVPDRDLFEAMMQRIAAEAAAQR
jgi:hypothetical protein